MSDDILVIGAGIAGIQASLLLAEAGKKVYLLEKTSMIGGSAIKFEEVFPNMECSTCMLAPKQQELLQNPNIQLFLLAKLESLEGSIGNFTAKVKVKAGYVDSIACIGCGACYEPCPVSVLNRFEENLAERKAIYVPCAGALPNVPIIDVENCLRFTKGEECMLCKEACMFEAIDFAQQDKELTLNVGAVIVATGFDEIDVRQLAQYGYGNMECVYTAMEFERLFASNGPTLGQLTLRNGETPQRIAIIHCVGREEAGYCSGICCMYSIKFARYIMHKLPDAQIFLMHSDLCLPGKLGEQFYKNTNKDKVSFVRCENVKIEPDGGKAVVKYGANGTSVLVDMVVLAPAIIGNRANGELAQILDIQCDEAGFFASKAGFPGSVETTREGIYLAGCAESPKDIAASVSQANAAVGVLLHKLEIFKNLKHEI